MKLDLKRERFSEHSTIGSLFVNGEFECYTLEDVVRDHKIPGETAIPEGTYQVIITFSPRFKRPLPLLVDVPNYSGVRIHPGNTDRDTEGCILVGISRGKDIIGGSRVAFSRLFGKVTNAIAQGEKVELSISAIKPPA
jgi:hypothetical protein